MKTKTLLLFLLTFNFLTIAQTLEHSYTSDSQEGLGKSKNFAFYSGGQLYFWTMDSSNNQISIYNQNHSLYKTINLSIPSGFSLNKQYFSSDKLFNSDSKMEFVIGIERGYSEYKILIYNEDGGNSVFESATSSDSFAVDIIKDSNNNYKLMITEEGKGGGNTIDIYSVSGTLSAEQENLLNNRIIQFPNPTNEILNIVNIENKGSNYLEIYSTNGKKVLTKKVSKNSKNISVNISSLKKGIYIYRIGDYTNKFIKN